MTVKHPQTPDELYGPLFHEVQTQRIFKDSKTFADAIPKSTSTEIMELYRASHDASDFVLKDFVQTHFEIPEQEERKHSLDPKAKNAAAHIHALWPQLTKPTTQKAHGTLLELPYPYVVPGGRFREIYYWDSYFTMLGLIHAGNLPLVKQMVDNFAHLLYTHGHIPNGNRTYFLSRSQPPFFALMVGLLVAVDDEVSYSDYINALTTEYHFWMDGHDHLSDQNPAQRRVVRVGDFMLNRYYDDYPHPRQESYLEDLEDASALEDKPTFYRHVRAACESGWDFSSRWMRDPHDIKTIYTCDIIPVDLNCLLHQLEWTIHEAYRELGDVALASQYQIAAEKRQRAINMLLWDPSIGQYFDYDFIKKEVIQKHHAACLYPLFTEIAAQHQAQSVRDHLVEKLLKKGGIATTDQYTNHQWDAPNGWPPLQWIAVKALDYYDFHKDARDIAKRWIQTCDIKFGQDYKMIEKYNIEDALATAKGGEYPAQDGFGWSNGVYMAMKGWLEHSR